MRAPGLFIAAQLIQTKGVIGKRKRTRTDSDSDRAGHTTGWFSVSKYKYGCSRKDRFPRIRCCTDTMDRAVAIKAPIENFLFLKEGYENVHCKHHALFFSMPVGKG
ncbi:hypothetical protein CEXT_687671 [Caerostris extrusa]|uniref:Uncharacterized protein n=1 Tax=Caerostris extrusa TaxID=172846 RepID=A0AAV4TYT0_CAEEX|nr:hypothetical protein CEXT_687671 [Caerostris extrusa]